MDDAEAARPPLTTAGPVSGSACGADGACTPLTTAVLLASTAPVSPADLARQAGADLLCPGYEFVDEELVRHCLEGGVRVVPWTVNDPEHTKRLIDWGVTGLTTDFPDRMADFLRTWGIEF